MVHPRVRGERLCVGNGFCAFTGSSPRARGTLCAGLLDATEIRFIPACAGNAPTPCTELIPDPIHPRVRGERRGESTRITIDDGSSPRARGTHAR